MCSCWTRVGIFLIGCNHYLSDVIRLQLSDQSLILARRATSISVKVCSLSPLLGNTYYCLCRAGSLVLIKDLFISHPLFKQPLGLSGSGTNLARSFSFAPIAFCYMLACVVTPIDMFCSYLSTWPHFIIDSGTCGLWHIVNACILSTLVWT